ncbi:hypothetical protein ACFQVC_33065 [Streptomyces monticola]|uniref:Uncharacterized protein n=1 Tax=Streptomyces monticola TaxID=2666263 RepID=A0ABW2JUL7_9ACTN
MRREISATISLLADEQDFRAMQHYRSFAFDDYAAYLAWIEDLLKVCASQGSHTTLALFDPQDYADFCADTGLDPDSPSSRSRYTAELATTGPTIPYDGTPLADLVPVLIDRALRQATWEYATDLLDHLGTCASCGKDVGQEAFTRAAGLLARILAAARPGHQHLACSISAEPEALIVTLDADTDDDGDVHLDETEALEFTTVLALGLSNQPGGLVLRASAPSVADHICGWRLHEGDLAPLTSAEVFDAYCTDIDSGEPLAPEPGVVYCVPPDLGSKGPMPGRHP